MGMGAGYWIWKNQSSNRRKYQEYKKQEYSRRAARDAALRAYDWRGIIADEIQERQDRLDFEEARRQYLLEHPKRGWLHR